jgi:hypothetical protein
MLPPHWWSPDPAGPVIPAARPPTTSSSPTPDSPQDVPRANPPVRERHNQMNAMLKAADGTASLPIHPRCKTPLRDLETVKLKPGTQYVETELRKHHVATAVGYLVARLFPARRHVKSGRKHWKQGGRTLRSPAGITARAT